MWQHTNVFNLRYPELFETHANQEFTIVRVRSSPTRCSTFIWICESVNVPVLYRIIVAPSRLIDTRSSKFENKIWALSRQWILLESLTFYLLVHYGTCCSNIAWDPLDSHAISIFPRRLEFKEGHVWQSLTTKFHLMQSTTTIYPNISSDQLQAIRRQYRGNVEKVLPFMIIPILLLFTLNNQRPSWTLTSSPTHASFL